jgi:hypothetical protein
MIEWLKKLFRKFRKTVIPPTVRLPNGRTAEIDERGNFVKWVDSGP